MEDDMKRFKVLLGGVFVASAAMLLAPATRAGVDISFGMNAPIGDDGNLFFSISSRYFDREPRVVQDWGRRFPNPDDLSAFLFICSRTRVAPDVVFRYRNAGSSWYDVGVRVGIPVETWYVPVSRDPGPPYGKAYGYYRKHQSDPHYRVRLTDRQVRDLVAVRMAHDYYGVSPEVAMDWRRNGTDCRTMMTREYRSRHRNDDRQAHNRDRGYDDHRDDHHDKSNGKDKSKGHDDNDNHGHHGDHGRHGEK
jgi:hypothetical protein